MTKEVLPFEGAKAPLGGRRATVGAITTPSRVNASPEAPLEGVKSKRAQAAAKASRPAPSSREASEPELSNHLSQYMRDIGRFELLTAAEEIELAALIKAGDEAAREKMINANLRLVVKIARDYEGFGLPLSDLINEGNIGLMKAVERFDPAKGGKLSTYASWWIKQSVKRALGNQSKTIRLPLHLIDRLSKMRRVTARYLEEFGREPTDEELANELEIAVSRIRLLRRSSQRTVSLDSHLGDDTTNRLEDVVADESAEMPDQTLEEKTILDTIPALFDQLPEREAEILRQRFGLDGGDGRTLEEVGEDFGVTRERIRQLQNLALRKLRKMIEGDKTDAVLAAPSVRSR